MFFLKATGLECLQLSVILHSKEAHLEAACAQCLQFILLRLNSYMCPK